MMVGTVVFSKKGRDKRLPFVVIEIADDFVFLVDGKLRPLANPKRKKIKHIQPTNIVHDLSLYAKRGLQDADIRKLLLPFAEKEVKTIV